MDCQITTLQNMHEKVSLISLIWQRTRKIIHALKRRSHYINKWISTNARIELFQNREKLKAHPNSKLKPGEYVRIKTKQEIEKTLDEWNRLKGCTFMKEMWKYCETNQRIFKKVKQFLDERDYVIKKTKGVYLLEGIYCDGAKDFGPCDRSCFFFWREEWLDNLSNDELNNQLS